MRSFQQSTNVTTKRTYIQHFVDWCNSTHNAYYIRGTLDSQAFYDVLTIGLNSLKDFSRIIDDFLRVDRYKKEKFADLGPLRVNADTKDDDLRAVFRLFKIYWLAQDINHKQTIHAPVQLLSFGYPMINCHPGSDKRYSIMFLTDPIDVPYVYIDYSTVPYKFYENWDYEVCDTAEKIENCFVNFEHPTFNTVYEWIEMWRDGCSPHNNPVYTGLKKYHKKMDTWNDYRFKMAFWHLSYYDAIHREGMWQDIDMLWDIQQQDDHTLWIGPKRMIKQNGIWRPDNGNFNTIYNPTSPIDCTTPYSSRWF